MESPPRSREFAPIGAALVVFGLALALRLFHLREIGVNDPFFTLPSVDGAIYDRWARSMLETGQLVEHVLYLGPLYPLVMSALYSLVGPSLPALKLAQAVLGSLSCVLVWGVAREAFGARVGLVAGILAALNAMMIFYGGAVMIVNVQIPLVLGLGWALMRADRQPTPGRWALCGLLLGLSALARQTVLMLAPVILGWILVGPEVLRRLRGEGPARGGETALPEDDEEASPRPAPGKRIAHALAFGTVIAALILPFTLHNWRAEQDLVWLNSTGGISFYMGNQRGADGTWKVPSLGTRTRVDNPDAMRVAFAEAAEEATGQAMKPSAISAYWLRRGMDEIRADPIRWLRLEFRKLALFLNAYETWNNRSFEISRNFSWVLRAAPIHFGVFAPFALLGLWLSRNRWRRLLPLYALLGAYLASALLFLVISRYRMPATVVLLPFAAHTLVVAFDRLRESPFPSEWLGRSAVALMALFALVHAPIASEERMHMAYYNLGNKFRALERWDEAIRAYQRSLAENPRAISTHNNLALAHEGAGNSRAAIDAWERVGDMAYRVGDRTRMERAARHLRDLGVEFPDAVEGGAAPSP